jgi:hypothetical protein
MYHKELPIISCYNVLKFPKSPLFPNLLFDLEQWSWEAILGNNQQKGK